MVELIASYRAELNLNLNDNFKYFMQIDQQYNLVSLHFTKFSFQYFSLHFYRRFFKTLNNLKSGSIISPYLVLTTNNPFFLNEKYLVSYIKRTNFSVNLFSRVKKSYFPCNYFC